MTEALAQVRRLAQEHGNDLAFVVNHSGVEDSNENDGSGPADVPGLPDSCRHGGHRL